MLAAVVSSHGQSRNYLITLHMWGFTKKLYKIFNKNDREAMDPATEGT